jgi:hypothetical protein
LQPVDTGALTQAGFATGQAIVKQAQTQHALRAYLAHPEDPKYYNALAAFNPEAAASIQRQQMLRTKMQRDAEDLRRTQALGTQYASGDTAGARQGAIAAGDLDLAKQFDALDEPNRKRAAETWQHVGPIAYKLKQTKDPEARKALWAQARPILEASGADAKTLDGFDPLNDTQIEAALTTSQKVGELIDQGKITWHQQGEQPSFATDSMGRPVGAQNPYANAAGTPAAPHPAAQAVGGVLAGSGMPAPAVAGFLGNFHAEGGYGGAKGDGGTASGIAQWRGDRAANFQRVIGKPPAQATPEESAQFVVWEMQHPEAAGMTAAQRDAILAAPTAEAAASLIDRYYERSGGEHRSRRVGAAKSYAVALGAPHHVTSKAEFDSLPSGAVFVAPDGSTRRKP